MRRMENDLLFFHELIGTCSVEKDSKIYTISPKFGKGTMQSFEVMPGAEIVYSNVHITTPIQKNIQYTDRFIEVTYCFHGRMNMSVSYTHLDVYKRQVLNNAPSLGELEAKAKAGEQISLTDLAAAVKAEEKLSLIHIYPAGQGF